MEFQKFDDAAGDVPTHAQEHARRFRHSYLGTEHLLLGLLDDEQTAASRVIRSRVELAQVRQAIETIVGSGTEEISGEIGLTPRSKRVIELAIEESRRLGDGFIGSEHILLGLLREGEGIAAGVLAMFGLDLERLREDVLRLRPTGGHASEA